MRHLARKHLAAVKNYTPGKPIDEVKREHGLSSVIKLASNENSLGPSPKALAAVRRALGEVNRYPDAANFYLKKRLARFLGVDGEQLFFGNGSDEVIVLAIRTFVDAGEEVVVAKPSFLIYEIASQVQGARIRTVPLKDDLRYDLEAMAAAVTKRTKMVFIANPDNPTGRYISRADLERFLKRLPRHIIVFLDEAYYEFARDAFTDYPNGLDYLGDPRIIVARTFSKIYGLAGLRIGYAVADPEVIACMEKVREPFNINLLAQVGAVAALDDDAFLRRTLALARRERAFLYRHFRAMGLSYVETATNFVLVDVGRDCKEVFTALLKKGVIVRDMQSWGMHTFIRVTIGTPAENKRFIAALKKVLAAASHKESV